MVREILQSRLDAPIVFAGNEDESVGTANFLRQILKGRGGLALRIFLVYPDSTIVRKTACHGAILGFVIGA
jgi:hypothetical protein